MPKSRSSRKSRKGRRPAPKPPAAPARRVVAQPLAVAAPGVAPTVSVPKERPAAGRAVRRDYSYVRRDLQRMAILAGAVLLTIIVLSFFLP